MKNSPHYNCHLVSKVHTASFVKQSPISTINKADCNVVPSSCSTDKCLSFANVSSHTHNDEILWHARLGHVPFLKMRNISAIPVNFSPKQPFTCNICLMARQTRMPFP